MTIEEVTTDARVAASFAVMRQLRPHLAEDEFVGRVRRQQASGYRLVALEEAGEVRAVAGFRVLEQLVRGRVLYVDDLVTDEDARSRGYGDALFDWLLAHARADHCEALELDSGVQRHGAHRFYLRKRMDITAYHFVLPLR
jgi:GNAT superfamily N-acetyltransferase